MDNPQDLPEAQRLDYAPPLSKKRFPWLLLFASPFIAIGTGMLFSMMLFMADVHDKVAVFAGVGVGFLTFGGMLVLIHLRWK